MAFSVNYTTTANQQKAYKKMVTPLYKAFKTRTEEYRWFDTVPDEDITPSPRENLIPLDVYRGYGAANIPDAGYEARTVTPGLEEGSFDFVHTNARFSISLRAKAFDQRARGAQIIRQIKHSSLKCMEAVSRKFGLMTYGFSTGVVAKLNGDPGGAAGSHAAVALKDAFGYSGLGNAAYLGGLFTAGEGVGLIRAGALIGIGQISNPSTTAGTVDITWNSGNTDPADGDSLVMFNAVTDTTISGSDYNLWPVGYLDALTSASVHGLATSTASEWQAALADSNGGRFDFVKLQNLRLAIQNKGDGDLDQIVWANGVMTDATAGERAARVYSGNSFDLDGKIEADGIQFLTSPLVPNGVVFGQDKSAFAKKVLTDKPDEEGLIDWGQLYKAEDRSAWKGGVDVIFARIVRSRRKMGYYLGLDEQ